MKMNPGLCALMFVTAVAVACAGLPTAAADDRDVLNVLFVATGGPSWTNSTNWATNTSICSWFGVVCTSVNGTDGQNGTVSALLLAGNHLNGTLPSLAPLSSLSVLNVSGNFIEGPIPLLPSLLTKVDLSGNTNLTGSIPSSALGPNTTLTWWDCRRTAMSIADPLTQLSFMGNVTEFPDLNIVCSAAQFNNLPAGTLVLVDPLYYLYKTCGCTDGYYGFIPHCELVAPGVSASLLALHASLGGPGWTNVTGWTADTSFCTWTGISCSSWTVGLDDDYRNIRTGHNYAYSVDLRARNLVGTIPDTLYGPTILYFYLSNNNISGTIPSSIGSFPINQLDLSSNDLVGWLPDSFATLPASTLFLGNNRLSGFFNSSQLPAKLMKLDISGNAGLTGPLPFAWILAHPTFHWLRASDTGLHGPAGNVTENLIFIDGTYVAYPTFICRSPSTMDLFMLDISPSYYDYIGCKCTPWYVGTAPNCVADDTIARAALLDLFASCGGSNWVNSAGWNTSISVCQWYGVTCNDSVAVAGNGTSTILVSIALPSNNLRGELPASLANLNGTLNYLDLSGNQLGVALSSSSSSAAAETSSTLPAFLAALSNVNYIDLSGNAFTGLFPDSFANWTAAVSLAVANNQLAGNITFAPLPPYATLVDISGNGGIFGQLPYPWLVFHKREHVFDATRTGMLGTDGEITAFFRFDPTRLVNVGDDLVCEAWTDTLVSYTNTVYLSPSYYLYRNCSCAGEYVGTAPNCYSERAALESLYNATGGDNWVRPWPIGNMSIPHCQWPGVCCAPAASNLSTTTPGFPTIPACQSTGFVVALDLSSNNLNGTIPTSLGGALVALQRFRAHSNALTGSIAATFANATRLVDFSVHTNQLSGPLPNLSAATSLFLLDLSQNAFTGPFGADILGRNLSSVNLSGNPGLTGPIPFDWVLSAQRELVVLNLLDTGLRAPSGVPSPLVFNASQVDDFAGNFQCPHASIAGFDSAVFTFMLDPAYYGFSGCSCIFGYNGTAPQCSIDADGVLMRLYRLTNGPTWTVQTGWNQLKSINPSAVAATVNGNVESSSPSSPINVCSFYGVCCGNASLWDLKTRTCAANGTIIGIHLGTNNLNGPLPSELNLLTGLQFLNFADNRLNGSLPSTIGALPALTDLLLNKNQFSGSFFSVAALTELENLNIADNALNLTLTPASGFGSLLNLRTLTLTGNAILEPIPDSLAPQWPQLTAFTAPHTGLLGTVPASLLALPHLAVVDLRSNLLTGTIPTPDSPTFSIATNTTSSSLSIVLLSNNGLTGSIPDSLLAAASASLTILDVSANRLTGALPTAVAELAALRSFNVSQNELSGTLSRANLPPNATLVDLSGNRAIGGAVPFAFLASDPDLEFVGLVGTSVVATNATEIREYLRFRTTAKPIVSASGHFECAVPYVDSGSGSGAELDLDPSAYGYLHCSCLAGYKGVVPSCRYSKKESDTGMIIGILFGVAAVITIIAAVIKYRRRSMAQAAGFRGFNNSV